jgi:hypothetical protein
LLATSTNALPILTWNYIEVKLTVADSGGNWEVRVNESTWINFTGDTKQSTTLSTALPASRSGAAALTTPSTICMSAIAQAAPTTPSSVMCVSIRCGLSVLATIQNSAKLEAPATGITLTTRRWIAIPPTTTATRWDSVTRSIAGIFLQSQGTIFGVQVNMAARKDDAGGRTLRSLTRVSGNDYEGDSQNVGTDYRVYRQIIEKNPNTTAAWTESEINGAEFGYKVQA